MRFWEAMQSKWGFSDGEAIPEGAELYRAVYILAVNRLAEQLDSAVRAVAYNRYGVHNFCLIIFHRVDDLKDVPDDQYTEHVNIRAAVVPPDEAMREAIRQAYEAHLDNLIQITVDIDPDLDDFIADFKPIDEDGPLVEMVFGEAQHIYPDGQVAVISQEWLAEHQIAPDDNRFTVQYVHHRDGVLSVYSADEQHYIVAAHLVRVLHIPESQREDSTERSPVPPYRVEQVPAGERNTPAADAGLAERYLSYAEAQRALESVYERTGGAWQIVNGYGNPCRPLSGDDTPTHERA